MVGKTCLVTGANTGIGKETALALATAGAHVIMVCRDRERAEAALADVQGRSGNSAVELELCDLASLGAIRRLAEDVRKRHRQLHVLVNNAAISMTDRQLTDDGLEKTFAVNHLAYFLLSNLLLDLLRAAAPARIVNVSSKLHEYGSIDFSDLQMERGFTGVKAYSNSKLGNVLFTYALGRRVHGSGVSVNCLHPGAVATDIYRNYPWPVRLITRWFLTNPEDGAATSIFLAASPEVEGLSGQYFVACRPARSSPVSYDCDLQDKLWDVSARLVGL